MSSNAYYQEGGAAQESAQQFQQASGAPVQHSTIGSPQHNPPQYGTQEHPQSGYAQPNYEQGTQAGHGQGTQGGQQLHENYGNNAQQTQGGQQLHENYGNNAQQTQGAQQGYGNATNGNAVNGNAANEAKKDTLTKYLEKIEKKYGGERFNNPDNEAKNAAMNQNIMKRVKQAMAMVIKQAPRMLPKLMNMLR